LAGPLGRWFRPRPPLAVQGPGQGPNESGNADSSGASKSLSEQTHVNHLSRKSHLAVNSQSDNGSHTVKEPATKEQATPHLLDGGVLGPPSPMGAHQAKHVSKGK